MTELDYQPWVHLPSGRPLLCHTWPSALWASPEESQVCWGRDATHHTHGLAATVAAKPKAQVATWALFWSDPSFFFSTSQVLDTFYLPLSFVFLHFHLALCLERLNFMDVLLIGKVRKCRVFIPLLVYLHRARAFLECLSWGFKFPWFLETAPALYSFKLRETSSCLLQGSNHPCEFSPKALLIDSSPLWLCVCVTGVLPTLDCRVLLQWVRL